MEIFDEKMYERQMIQAENEKINREKTDGEVQQLRKYFENKGLLIVGFNDSQGMNVTPAFFRKALLERIAATLTSENLTPEVINAFSLLLNKTEHIDWVLKANLSVEEIKRLQVAGSVSAFEKVMEENRLPSFLANIGYLYKLCYPIKKGDDKMHISYYLKKADEPQVIISSGLNNAMREMGSNPFCIKRDYRGRYKYHNYDYAAEKAKDPSTLEKVSDGVRGNLDSILGINDNADIYMLGGYIPESLLGKGMEPFKDFINSYNEVMLRICAEYGASFIDTMKIGEQYGTAGNNFHITADGHDALASSVLSSMYERKIDGIKPESAVKPKLFEFSRGSDPDVIFPELEGEIYDLSDEIMAQDALLGTMNLAKNDDQTLRTLYEQQRRYERLEERKRERDVLCKALINPKTK